MSVSLQSVGSFHRWSLHSQPFQHTGVLLHRSKWPLCAIRRKGCARFQEGKELVEKRECTSGSSPLRSGSSVKINQTGLSPSPIRAKTCLGLMSESLWVQVFRPSVLRAGRAEHPRPRTQCIALTSLDHPTGGGEGFEPGPSTEGAVLFF